MTRPKSTRYYTYLIYARLLRLHRAVINEGDSARVRSWTDEGSLVKLCSQIEDLTCSRYEYHVARRPIRSMASLSRYTIIGDSIVIKTREIRPRILVIHSMFKTREESDSRVVSKIDLILHSNTNITEASSRLVIKRPIKLSYTIPTDISAGRRAGLFQHFHKTYLQ